jgi:hypothetical protein
MKYLLLFFAGVLLFSGCKENTVEKPENLITEDGMVNIIYDLSLFEAIRSNSPDSLVEQHIDPEYIYKKYKIDSLQFAKNDRYYATDIDRYAKIYDRVAKRLERHKKQTDSILKKNQETVKMLKPKPDSIIKLARLRGKSKQIYKPAEK